MTPRPGTGSDAWTLSLISLFTQVLCALALYLYGAVSTPAYLSVLLAAPAILLLCVFAGRGVRLPRWLAPLPCLASLLDALIAFYALCAVLRDVMPDIQLPAAALLYALCLAAGLAGAAPSALPRTARLMLLVLLPMAFFCLCCALPHGKTEHLFPLLGFGPASVLRGCIWVLGASAGVCCPLLSAGGPPRRRMLLSLLAAFFLAAAAALAAAWLMPVYALAAPRTVGWRMLLVTHMTPSVPCWSVQVALVTLLLLLSLAVSVRRAAAFAASSFGVERKAGNHWAETLFLLLLIPFSAMQTESVRAFLVTAGPLRFPCMAAAAVGSYAAGRRRK